MNHRHLLLLGVLILIIPLASGSLGLYYAYRASEWPEQDERVGIARVLEEENKVEIRYRLEVTDDWNYMTIGAGFGGCCPAFEEGDALNAVVTTPYGETYTFNVETRECHMGERDFCDYDESYPGGRDYLIIVKPPKGDYHVTIYPAGNLEEFHQYHQAGASASGYTSLVNDPTLGGDNIWWYYPDDSKKLVKDGHYFGWETALPRLWGLGALTVAGLAASVVTLNRARSRSSEVTE